MNGLLPVVPMFTGTEGGTDCTKQIGRPPQRHMQLSHLNVNRFQGSTLPSIRQWACPGSESSVHQALSSQKASTCCRCHALKQLPIRALSGFLRAYFQRCYSKI